MRVVEKKEGAKTEVEEKHKTLISETLVLFSGQAEPAIGQICSLATFYILGISKACPWPNEDAITY